MGRRSWVVRTLAVTGLAATALSSVVARASAQTPARSLERAQTIRWNAAAAASDTVEDAPIVNLRIEGSSLFSYGEPVRVWFNVSQDAYVIVARVDANGHLTLLYPSSRTMSSGVEGGREIPIRGRRGGASFYATDRMGGGFVFAMASYDPFDLSRLGLRDFDRYVTGTYVGRPSRVYIGDPHRVVTRFASMVSFSDESPYDYAVEYYQVDAPYYVTSVGFSNFCNGFYGGYRRGLLERWDDELFYGNAMASNYGCNYNCPSYGYTAGYGYPFFINPACGFNRNQGNQNGPPIPTQPPKDSSRVPPWLPDSIKGGRPDTVSNVPETKGTDDTNLRRRIALMDGSYGGASTNEFDPSRKSYAIPERALRNSPMTFGEGRERGGEATARPDRRNASAGGPDIAWVRPPRDVIEASSNAGGGALPRSPRNGVTRGDGSDYRGGRSTFVSGSEGRSGVRAEPPRYEPPTRTFGPRFDAPPPSVRNSLDSPRYDTPPPRFDAPRGNDGPRYSPPSATGSSSGSASGGAASGSPRGGEGGGARSEPVRPASDGAGARPASTEKKPDAK
ncbi:MAG: DUF4384 domain-containing protein [Gemmatimonadaceae bacterium]|nr:DUF4384 domain-containing protein [Gemmatimonadaceae bacterium]